MYHFKVSVGGKNREKWCGEGARDGVVVILETNFCSRVDHVLARQLQFLSLGKTFPQKALKETNFCKIYFVFYRGKSLLKAGLFVKDNTFYNIRQCVNFFFDSYSASDSCYGNMRKKE